MPRLLALGSAVLVALAGPAQADPISRFLDGLWKSDPAPAAPAAASAPAPPARLPGKPVPAAKPKPAAVRSGVPATSKPVAQAAAPLAARPAAAPVPKPLAARPAAPVAAAAKPVAAKPQAKPVATAAADPSVPVVRPAPPAPAPQPAAVQPAVSVPTTPQAAIERVNAYFNAIDQLTASFSQTSPGGRSGGTLALKRPGQLHFAYAPPSTLEIVSDGKSVAVRDKKLGTNDVYSIGQTPLKFLLKEDFDLGRDTKVRDVQTSPEGIVTIRFEDSATFGGTSKITLRFDARANALRQWTVIDPQGFETTVSLSNVQMVRRQSAGLN
jgi:outer membrane lipoprotein-sorting protein